MKLKSLFWGITLILAVTACQKNDTGTEQDLEQSSPMDAYIGLKGASIGSEVTSEFLDKINVGLAARGLGYHISKAEYYTASGSKEPGKIVYAHHTGNKQLEVDFVPNDVRREWSGANPNEITYAIDQTGDAIPPGGGLTATETDAAIERAFTTWRNASCSDLGLVRNADYGMDVGLVANVFSDLVGGTGGSPYVFADIQIAGWGNIDFPDGILGVTFIFSFDEAGVPTDIDNNGKFDAAFCETYFDPSWIWGDDGSTNANDGSPIIDVESIAVHEIGHGLSQDHFGKVSVSKKGEFKVSPRAVMNAFYSSPLRELQGSDNGGHCSIWSSWPNK